MKKAEEGAGKGNGVRREKRKLRQRKGVEKRQNNSSKSGRKREKIIDENGVKKREKITPKKGGKGRRKKGQKHLFFGLKKRPFSEVKSGVKAGSDFRL